jgi:dTDP-4-dehydrorhamnose reductase
MDILVLGGAGQVGTELRALSSPGMRIVAPSRAELDLGAAGEIAAWVAARPWAAIINAAAYTDVDKAESERDAAWRVNATAPGRLAREAARRDIPLVHISTDYVFDGRKGRPYVPSDPVHPLGVYGASKEAGEQGVRDNPRHVILRTSWVHSPTGRNFVRTMLRLANERESIRVVDDQRGSPTAARDVAQACLAIVSRIAADPEGAPYGTYHFANAGETTWCGFARQIFALARPRLARVPEVVPITTREYPTPAERPADSRLDCAATTAQWGIVPRDWHAGLADTLARLLAD